MCGASPKDFRNNNCLQLTSVRGSEVMCWYFLYAGKLEYQAQSPDEGALVSAAKNFGYAFKVSTCGTGGPIFPIFPYIFFSFPYISLFFPHFALYVSHQINRENPKKIP